MKRTKPCALRVTVRPASDSAEPVEAANLAQVTSSARDQGSDRKAPGNSSSACLFENLCLLSSPGHMGHQVSASCLLLSAKKAHRCHHHATEKRSPAGVSPEADVQWLHDPGMLSHHILFYSMIKYFRRFCISRILGRKKK